MLQPGCPGLPPPPINWRQVEDNAEFACSHVTNSERLLHYTLDSVSWNIMHLIRVSMKKRRKFACVPLASFEFPHSLLSLSLQHLSQGSVGTHVLQAMLTRAWKVVLQRLPTSWRCLLRRLLL
jgi:hypothetical protein